MNKPNLVNDQYTAFLRSGLYVPTSVHKKMQELSAKGWTFWAVDQSRGRCYYGSKIITIPVWVFKRTTGKLVWYICHEMAHAITPLMYESHGTEFMRNLARICPSEYIHYEAEYKPRNLIRSGVPLNAETCGF